MVKLDGLLHGMKGQAAMEYLMTYGWALLVIVIVIAILLIINPFSAPQGCRFDDLAFSCSNPVVDQGGSLSVAITNGQNTAITHVNIGCTTDKSPTVPSDLAPVPVYYQGASGTDLKVPRQGVIKIGGNGPNQVPCGTQGGVLNIGEDFSGKIWMFYQTLDEANNGYTTYHTASASFVTKVGATAG